MKFSTRAEYGLKAMINLAHTFPGQKSIKELSEEESISLKYLERLMGTLKKNGLVLSTKGQSGGYVLSKKPSQMTAGEVIEALDGPIAPMKCTSSNCAIAKSCNSSTIWTELEHQIKKTLYGYTLKKLTDKK
ncbi:MAG: Transcriptional regulator, BadM/Rrf2 family [Candidatus Moranbacteria bacterium GW2011_GWE1_49_15]|nr:MAG: Transcriptional regulator, BadM/Rrf2 family [Candidatus Moranbacteria bacterium GW2011_GWE2_47_10]KKW07091.1 MAG: Transcriptional regulator, BadM/Rrf2 family [Candidatus Moranbacteria bacterium GW2011_GWE1_49_15]HBP01443.1 Rrf2 family transcriptional regulator [Candidatus Moranbacteria bacterium]